MITSIDTVTQVSINIRKKEEKHKSIGINTEHNTNNTPLKWREMCTNMEEEGNVYTGSGTYKHELE